MVVDEGNGDGDGEGVEEIDPPNHPPHLPQWLLKALGPQSAPARKAGPIPWSPQVLEQECAGNQPVPPPPHSHMTVMWIFRRLVRCLIRRKKGVHRGTWGKDASKGGVWVWKQLPGAPLAPMPEAISVGALPAMNLLFHPRGVRFGTPHYLVLLQHWAQLGWVRQRRQGKVVAFGVDWATVLALPRPIYDPGCQFSYEGLVPQSRAVKAAAVAATAAKPGAHVAPMASAGAPVAPVEAASAASLFREAMGAVQAGGTNGSFEVCCLPACINF